MIHGLSRRRVLLAGVAGVGAGCPALLGAEQPAAAKHREYLEKFLGDIATFLMNA